MVAKKNGKKGVFLGMRISEEYEAKLIKRKNKQRDVGKSHTARKILYAALDRS